jgi:hypothetical protein
MTCWDLNVEPRSCRGLIAAAVVAHLAAACVPWIAGCDPAVSLALSALALTGVVPTARSIPGPWSRIRSLQAGCDGWRATLADGRTAPLAVHQATRVYRDLVVIRLAKDGPGSSWLVKRGSVDPATFRRLKVRLRALRQERGRPDPAARMP